MSGTKVVEKTPTELLKRDHRLVRDLFTDYEKLGSADAKEKDRIWQGINDALTLHSEIEEQLFYPAVRGVKADRAEDLVDAAVEEHHVVRTLLEELSWIEPGLEAFDAKMRTLRQNVLRHIEEEEKTIFSLAQKLPKDVLENLVIEMERMKDDLEDRDVE